MARTTPVSNGWTTLTRPLGRILPLAEATISMVPHQAQTSATQNSSAMAAATARPMGDGGVSTISSAAGRNANSSLRCGVRRNGMIRGAGPACTDDSANFMESSLQPMQGCIAAAGFRSEEHTSELQSPYDL